MKIFNFSKLNSQIDIKDFFCIDEENFLVHLWGAPTPHRESWLMRVNQDETEEYRATGNNNYWENPWNSCRFAKCFGRFFIGKDSIAKLDEYYSHTPQDFKHKGQLHLNKIGVNRPDGKLLGFYHGNTKILNCDLELLETLRFCVSDSHGSSYLTFESLEIVFDSDGRVLDFIGIGNTSSTSNVFVPSGIKSGNYWDCHSLASLPFYGGLGEELGTYYQFFRCGKTVIGELFEIENGKSGKEETIRYKRFDSHYMCRHEDKFCILLKDKSVLIVDKHFDTIGNYDWTSEMGGAPVKAMFSDDGLKINLINHNCILSFDID